MPHETLVESRLGLSLYKLLDDPLRQQAQMSELCQIYWNKKGIVEIRWSAHTYMICRNSLNGKCTRPRNTAGAYCKG